MNLEWSTQDGWTGDPALVTVSAEAGLTCPQCQQHVSHLQVVIYEPGLVSIEIGAWDASAPRVTGYTVIPCLHEVSARDYGLFWRDGFMSFEPRGNDGDRADR